MSKRISDKISLPFKIIQTEVSGGFIDAVHTAFTGGIDIVNYHEDKYGSLDEAVLQSPFTQQWVGGKSHRHVGLNTGSDDSSNRPEAFHLQFNPNGVRFYSHAYRGSPPAYWSRDGLAKRPLNIANVRNNDLYVGNYSKGYQVLQTSGRRLTNNLIVDGFVASGSLTTQFVFGENNYTLPDLTRTGETVIVERFNAPGSKEESSRGALDREGEEMSPNAALPWRNYKIRQPFYSQLAQHSPQFGSGSTNAILPATGTVDAVSIHKVNRNTLVRAGNYQWDNGFVVHSLPRTDIQYSWITASSNTTAAELGGYQSFAGGFNRSEAYEDIDFISGSLIGDGVFVDNLYINSLVKDQKNLDLETKTFSISPSLSASFSEYTNSPYTFTTWTSIKNGDSPIARQLRKNNIISIQNAITNGKSALYPHPGATRRGNGSTNYTDPAVTFKYRPMRTSVAMRNAPDGSSQNIKHTYNNNLSSFANKDLIVRTGKREDKEQFYDFLKDLYTTQLGNPDNPITGFSSYSYQEIIWPREENTGIDETRKRKFYYLDQAGFTRDGYDIQLGTQRAYWRDEQVDRQRSPNSEGGHYNSFNYLSTVESGSSFTVSGSTVLLDESTYEYSSSFTQLTAIDSGLFNSISLMEYTPSETLVYSSSFLVYSASTDLLLYPNEQINVSYKRGYRFDTAGEFNHAFVDFYGVSKVSGSDILRDLGAIYRNSFYKSMLTTKQYEFGSSTDLIDTTALIKTEDDEIKIRPKLRYTAFVGGGELNQSDYVQDNFRNNIIEYSPINSELPNVSSISNVQLSSKLYSFIASAYNGKVIYITSSNGTSWSTALSSSDMIGEDSNDYFGNVIKSKEIDNKIYLYVSAYLSGSNEGAIYQFTSSDGSSWSPRTKIVSGDPNINFGSDFDVTYSDVTNTIHLFIGAPFSASSPGADEGAVYYITSSDYGTTWSSKQILESGPSTWNTDTRFGSTISALSSSGGYHVAIGSEYDYNARGALFIVTSSDGINWSSKFMIASGTENYSTYSNTSTTKIVQHDNKIYCFSDIDLSSGGGGDYGVYVISSSANNIWIPSEYTTDKKTILFKMSDYSFSSSYLLQREYDPQIDALQKDGKLYWGYSGPYGNGLNKIIVGSLGDTNWQIDKIFDFGGTIGTMNLFNFLDQNITSDILFLTSDQSQIFENVAQQYIPSTLFSETFTTDDVLFSTLDNGLQRTTERDSGRKPFFDSYNDYLEDVRGLSKDHSVIPEFRISEHIDFYVDEVSNFKYNNRAFLEIDGTDPYQSADSPSSSYDQVFWKTYATSDLLKKHDEIREENEEVAELDTVTIRVDGIKKLLPYNGFYPQDRITQIANLYNDYVDNNLGGGVYNVSYENAELLEELVAQHPEGDSSLGTINAISTIEFDGKYYIAVGYNYYNSYQGLVKIFSSSAGDYLDQDSWSQDSVIQYTGDSTGVYFGNSIKLLSGSNGLNLFVSQYGTNHAGAIYQMTSSNGVDWSTKVQMSSSVTEYITGSSNSYFGNQIDALYDENNGKFVLAIGAYRDSTYGTSAGAVYVVTSDDGSDWSNKASIYTLLTTTNTQLGASVSIMSGSYYDVGTKYAYQVAASFARENFTPGGIILQVSDDAGVTWSTPPSYTTFITSSQSYSKIGYGGLKILEYGLRTYVFYSEPAADSSGLTNNGKMYVAYSNIGHNWNTINTVLLAEGQYNSDNIVKGLFPYYNNISAVSSSAGALHYTFSAMDANSEIGSDVGKVFIGRSDDGTTFQTDNELNVITGPVAGSRLGGSATMILSGTTPISIYTGKQAIYGLTTGKNVSLNVVVSGSEVERAWKQAAIEPIFGPGIMYNTIKSGIAVDWPCATGSAAFITASNGVIINPFLPEAKIMTSYQGDNGFYNLQGSLKSKLDYRVSFENIIYPKEIFEEKDEITSNLRETYAVGVNVPTNSQISQLLSGAYIYGGYEPYVNPSDVGDIYGQTAKRFSVPFVYKKTDGSDSGLYTRAMSNFLAETVKFFLQDEKMVTFTSKPDSEWEDFRQGKTYYMDVVLEKSSDLTMMEAYWDDKHPIGLRGEKMNGRYFGYPVNKTTKDLWTGEQFTEEERRLIFNDPAYAPYTPPYFEGRAVARLSFSPDTDGSYSLNEIFSKLEITDLFTFASKGWEDGSDAQIHKMSVGASVDLFGSFNSTLTEINTATDGNVITSRASRQDVNSKVWVISPRMETPVLDFSEQTLVPYSNDYLKTSGYGRGMWSGYGSIPTGNKKISLALSSPYSREIGDSYDGRISNTQRLSLLKHVGFTAEEKTVGRLATEKEISEAIVVIPYLEIASRRNESVTYNSFLKKSLIKIDNELLRLQRKNIESGNPAIKAGEYGSQEDITETSISRMITKLKNYVLPPKLNFLDDTGVDPFVMYVFEFKHKLQQQDLANIWQGLMPDISYNAEVASDILGDDVVFSHPSSQYEFFQGKKLPDGLKWMVFKIKKKAEMDFGAVTRSTQDDERFRSELNIGQRESPYSYNWPYDYFSLVELAKVEIDLKYKKKEEVRPEAVGFALNRNS